MLSILAFLWSLIYLCRLLNMLDQGCHLVVKVDRSSVSLHSDLLISSAEVVFELVTELTGNRSFHVRLLSSRF